MASRPTSSGGALLIFSPPGDAGPHYMAQLAERLRAATAVLGPWNLRLVRGLRWRLRATWEEDAGFDLDYHFRQSALLPASEVNANSACWCRGSTACR